MSAFLSSEFEPAAADAARYHVIPVPYERTVSYGAGAANGPQAILAASYQLEAFDGQGYPGEKGIHTTAPVDVQGSAEEVLERIGDRVKAARSVGALPVMLGGEHTVSYGAIRALHDEVGRFGIVQIDAHADLRDRYDGTPWSHACVMRRAASLGLPLLQIGVRSLCTEEIEARRSLGVSFLDARDIHRGQGLDGILPDDFPEMVYVTFDVDGLDAAIMPATGTPEPGGLQFYDALDFVGFATRGRTVIGLDVVELAPKPGLHHADFTAAKLTYCLMGMCG